MEGGLVELPNDLAAKTDTTYRNERGYHGQRVDQLKSWLQKAIRRSLAEDAVWCAAEISTIPKQGIVTNLVTRLRVTVLEDIGVAGCGAVQVVERELRSIMDSKTDKVRLPVNGVTVAVFAKVAAFLARCKHIRLCSDYKAVFLSASFVDAAKLETVQRKLREEFSDVYADHAEMVEFLSKELDAKKVGARFQTCLRDKDDRAVYIMEKLLGLESPQKCYNSWKSIYFVMHLLKQTATELKRADLASEVDVLSKWLKEGLDSLKNEYILPPLHAVIRLLKRDHESACPDFESAVSSICVTNFVPSCQILEVPDWAKDKHTAQGRQRGMTALDFAREGALVNDEVVELVNQRYREVYVQNKVFQEEEDDEDDDRQKKKKRSKVDV
jgi:hypothetical protein